jgi:hypothetical protein
MSFKIFNWRKLGADTQYMISLGKIKKSKSIVHIFKNDLMFRFYPFSKNDYAFNDIIERTSLKLTYSWECHICKLNVRL